MMKKIKITAILFSLVFFITAGIYGGFGFGLPSIVRDKVETDMDEKVREKAFPSISITNPSAGALVSGSVNITADASDDKGVTKVEFYIDNLLKKTAKTPAYGYIWDTTAGTAGRHSIKAQAYNADNYSGLDSIGVIVDNGHAFPDTGQTTVYRAGDDASYNPPPNQMAYIDNGDGTVRDILTGLVWLKDADDFTERSSNWEDAIDNCESFSYAGHSDWRLPNIKELSSIFSFEGDTPYIEDAPFVNVVSGEYWSSTTDVQAYNVDGTTRAIGGNFSKGTVETYTKDTTHRVYPVRAGATGQERELPDTGQTTVYRAGDDASYNPAASSMSYTDNGNGTVTDNNTGLMWAMDGTGEGCNNGNKLSWAAAIDWAEELNFAGYEDWRLPNVKELLSIVKYEGSAPLINSTYFTNTGSGNYWSSTTLPSDPFSALSVSFGEGSVGYWPKTTTYLVRPVRDSQ